MSSRAEFPISDLETLLISDMDEVFEDNRSIIGISQDPDRPQMQTLFTLVGKLDKVFPTLIEPCLKLVRGEFELVGEQTFVLLEYNDNGEQAVASFILPPTAIETPRMEDEVAELFRDVVKSAEWDEALSQLFAQELTVDINE
jgi:hypothetical protein